MKQLYIFLSLLLTAIVANAQIFNTNVSIKGGNSPISTLSVNGSGSSDHQVYVAAPKKGIKCLRSGYTGYTDWVTAIEGFSAVGDANYCAGVHGYAYNSNQLASGRAYGVLGRGGYATTGHNYGVFGQLIGESYGAGIYGTESASDFGINVGNRYAGFFNGKVRVTGNLTVLGIIDGTLTGTGISSKFPQKQIAATNIDNVAEHFKFLNASSYYKEDYSKNSIKQTSDTLTGDRPLTAFEIQNLSKQHYALSADELEKMFPDLVYDQEDGSKSINYIEMIPLLVQAIGELKNEIDRLQNLNEMLVKASETGINDVENEIDICALGQNLPNPFSITTCIPISIPETTKEASLHIYDLNGKILLKRELTKRGSITEQVTLNGCEEGLYLYSLVADGVLIQTRRMILEKK